MAVAALIDRTARGAEMVRADGAHSGIVLNEMETLLAGGIAAAALVIGPTGCSSPPDSPGGTSSSQTSSATAASTVEPCRAKREEGGRHQSTAQNSRVPGFYQFFAENVLGRAPALFGTVVPLLETCLGIALIAGVLTLPAALWSVLQLCNYWLADQLIAQYPIMVILAAAAAVFASAASSFSVTALVARGRSIPSAALRWL